MKKVVIIIPTYNERENIKKLLPYLETKVFPKIKSKHDMHVLVVDDSSPDGTADEVKKLQKKYKNIHLLLNKKKSGLGGAYLKGMIEATDELKADIMFEMDADFSHDPNVIPQFLEKMDQGYDLVLGSRYIKGGSIPKDWGIHRKLLSILGNITIQAVITYFKIRDWTTGYRALTSDLFRSLRGEMKRREFSGYTWQIGFLHKAVRKGSNIAEVPIVFVDRQIGKSKLGVEYIKNTLFYIFTIRMQELQQVIKFAVVGTIGFIVNTLSFELFRNVFGLNAYAAVTIAFELAVISNFNLNNLWTFKDKKIRNLRDIFSKFVQFNLASLGSLLIQNLGMFIGKTLFGDAYELLYLVVAIGVGLFLNYLIYTKIIWKK